MLEIKEASHCRVPKAAASDRSHTLLPAPPCQTNLCRFRFCSAVLRDQLYMIGGMSAFEPATAEKHVVSDRVMRYMPSTNRWEMLPGGAVHVCRSAGQLARPLHTHTHSLG